MFGSVASRIVEFVPVSSRTLVREWLTADLMGSRVESVAEQLPIVGEELFRGALARERNRADRFNESLILVVIRIDGQHSPQQTAPWRSWLFALDAVKRDSDIVGWLEEGSALGLILPEIAAPDRSIAEKIEARIRGELRAHSDIRSGAAASVNASLYSGPAAAAAEPPDSICAQLLSASECRRIRDLSKRALDFLGSATLLALLSPLFLLIAALVSFRSPGPVLFRQKRIGQAGRSFEMLKFRTMHMNGDDAIHQQYVSWFIKSSDQAQHDANTVFKLTHDPRITPVGDILRKTSLDELPQLWNVLRGDMSLVGPRPPLQYEVEQYEPWHWRRVLDAKPGITGAWQVNGRSRTTFDEMVRLDLGYARKHSLWTDIRILLATPRAVISGKGAC